MGSLVYPVLIWVVLSGVAIGEEARFASEIATFLERDQAATPEEGCLLFVGSSTIRLWPLEKSFPELAPVNRGFGGSQMADLLHYLDQIVLPYRPRTIVLYEGDNDINAGKSSDIVVAEFQKFLGRVHAELPHTKIFYLATKPSIARWDKIEIIRDANRRIQEIATADELVTFVDTVTPMLGHDGAPRRELYVEDGLHLNEKGYALWTRLLAKYPEFSVVEVGPRE